MDSKSTKKPIETTPTVMMFVRVDPKRIVDLKSLLEGYEGLLVVRTQDPEEGIVQLLVSPDFRADVEAILADLSQRIWMEAVDSRRFNQDAIS